MIPVQLGVPTIPLDTRSLMILGSIVAIIIVLGGVLFVWKAGGAWKDYLPGRLAIYESMFEKAQRAILGPGDAICLIPYGDGVLARKRGYYHKNLVGNLPGYETEDGDLFIMDGDGDPVFTLAGVPVVLCIDPSEAAAVMHPLKALIGQKADIGEYVRVDRDDQVVARGKALEPADGSDTDPQVADESPLAINQQAHDELYDLRPPTRAAGTVDDATVADGGVTVVEKATGFVVSANKAASLLPNPPTTRELKIMQQRERNAAFDSSEMVKYIGIGALIGGGGVLAGVGVYAAMAGLL